MWHPRFYSSFLPILHASEGGMLESLNQVNKVKCVLGTVGRHNQWALATDMAMHGNTTQNLFVCLHGLLLAPFSLTSYTAVQ